MLLRDRLCEVECKCRMSLIPSQMQGRHCQGHDAHPVSGPVAILHDPEDDQTENHQHDDANHWIRNFLEERDHTSSHQSKDPKIAIRRANFKGHHSLSQNSLIWGGRKRNTLTFQGDWGEWGGLFLFDGRKKGLMVFKETIENVAYSRRRCRGRGACSSPPYKT